MATALVGLAAAGIAAFLVFGPPKALARSETPEFCAGCHVMRPQYEAWSRPGPHRFIRCIDCHLPNDNAVSHYAWKGIDGVKDIVVFYGGLVPDEIEASPHAERTLQANCVRCHQQMVSGIKTEGRRCWGCHREVAHRFGRAS